MSTRTQHNIKCQAAKAVFAQMCRVQAVAPAAFVAIPAMGNGQDPKPEAPDF